VNSLTKCLFAKLRTDYRENYLHEEVQNDTILHILRMRIKSISATSGPPIGPVLGQYGIPISKFCSEFNERTQIYNGYVHVFVTLYHYADGNFSFDIFAPTSSIFLRRAAQLNRCCGTQLRMRGGLLTPYLFYEAVVYKFMHTEESEIISFYSRLRSGLGTLRSMGISFIF
jgi:large subunit ribosomal protein L11